VLWHPWLRALAALASVVGRKPPSPHSGPHDGGGSVLRADSEVHLARCDRCGSLHNGGVGCTSSSASSSAEFWRLHRSVVVDNITGHRWCCRDAGGCGGRRHCLGEWFSASGCRLGLVAVVVVIC
jgi:hypothetical protein